MSEAKSIGWSVAEDLAFDSIMEAGGLERLPAIRLYRRCGCDLERALGIAKSQAVANAGSVKAMETRRQKASKRASGVQADVFAAA